MGFAGRVTAVDINASMIEVARSLPVVYGVPIDWQVANAMQLPLDDESVDAVLCAQTLQFLSDKQTSLDEMRRVTKPGGRMVLSLWCDITHNPYFDVLVSAISNYIGVETAVGLQSAFALSDPHTIHNLLRQAGFEHIEMHTTQLDLALPPLAEFIPRHISATPMAAGFNRAPESMQKVVIEEVIEKLKGYEENGRLQIPFRSHMIRIRK